MKISRKTKSWLKIQREIYDRFLDYLDKPSIINHMVMSRLGEVVEQTESRLREEGLDDVEVKAFMKTWIGG